MDGKKIDLKPGDGVIYRGCDIEHWRKNLMKGIIICKFFCIMLTPMENTQITKEIV